MSKSWEDGSVSLNVKTRNPTAWKPVTFDPYWLENRQFGGDNDTIELSGPLRYSQVLIVSPKSNDGNNGSIQERLSKVDEGKSSRQIIPDDMES